MGKQSKRGRRLGKQDRGIAPSALFNFALKMGAYFPSAVAIISLSLSHILLLTLSQPLTPTFPLMSFFLHVGLHYPPLSLLSLIDMSSESQLAVTDTCSCPDCESASMFGMCSADELQPPCCSHLLRVHFSGAPLKCAIFPIIFDYF